MRAGRSVVRQRVLMVCMGNICRSPTAEGVLRRKLEQAGLHAAVEVDSAGTHGWHEGAPPDPRSQEHASRRGYDLSRLRARPVRDADFDSFDLILAMDRDNLSALKDDCPGPHLQKLRLLMEFAPVGLGSVVPDPYYGTSRDFDRVLDLVEAACDGVVEYLRSEVAAGPPEDSL